jgi:hypothetical protein
MRSIPNPEHWNKRSPFLFSLCLVPGERHCSSGFLGEEQGFSASRAHAAPAVQHRLPAARVVLCRGYRSAAFPFTDDSSTVGAMNDIDPAQRVRFRVGSGRLLFQFFRHRHVRRRRDAAFARLM